jgi:hypothetical protein
MRYAQSVGRVSRSADVDRGGGRANSSSSSGTPITNNFSGRPVCVRASSKINPVGKIYRRARAGSNPIGAAGASRPSASDLIVGSMGKSQLDKGGRIEREIVDLHQAINVHAERYALSGASRFRGSGHDVDLYLFGRDATPLVAEVKARKNGSGFAQLENSGTAFHPKNSDWRSSGRSMICRTTAGCP